MDISAKGYMCFIGSRVNLIQFVDVGVTTSTNTHPMYVDFNAQQGELIIVGTREVQVLNIHDGRAIRLLRSFTDEDLTHFK